MTAEIRALASELAALKAYVKKRGDQLAYSSFDDGALREFKTDESGATQVAQYGQQFDGTSTAATLVSPLPPAPSVPYAVGVAGGINVTIDGTFEGDPTIIAPMDFKGFDITVGPIGFDPIATPPIVTITSPRGGAVFIALAPGNYEVAAITRTLAGRPSLPSPVDAATAFGSPTQAEVDQALADAAAAQDAADAAQGTADDALDSANGKSSVTHADYDPVAEPNSVGDTWFTHDSTSGAIIAQWRGMGGTTWQQDTISHQVISSIDLGVATVGKLAANYIESGVLSAALQIAGMLIAGLPTGARVVIDDAGIRQYSSAGDIRTNLPTDPDTPATFEGNAIMDSLTVVDFLAIRGINNEISKGAVVSLSSGTTAPTSAVSLAAGYQTYATPRHGTGFLYLPTGHNAALDDSDDFYGTYQFYGYGKMLGLAGKRYVWPERTDSEGNKRSTYSPASSTAISVGGSDRVVMVGNRCLNNGDVPHNFITTWDPSTMTNTGSTSPTVKVQQSITDDSFVWVTKVGRVFSATNTWRDRFALGIQRSLTSDFLLRVYSATDLAVTQQGADLVVASPFAAGESFIGVTFGESVKLGFPGATQNVWLIHGSKNTCAFTTAGVRIPQFDFPTPAGQSIMCAWGDLPTNAFLGFRTTAWRDDTPFTKLTNNHWDTTTTSSKWYASATWYDPDATGGTHETAQSARASITMPKRAGLTFTVPTFPARPFPTTTDDVLAARVYIARGNTDPGRANMERAATVTSPVRTGYIGTFAFPAGAAAAPPPVASNFPATAPAKLQSADGATWVLQGDGTAHLGALDVTSAGATTLLKATEVSVGDDTITTQRNVRWFRKVVDAWEIRRYLFNGTTFSGIADVLVKNGTEVARTELYPDGSLRVQSNPNGTADVTIDGLSMPRGVVPGGLVTLVADSNIVSSATITDVTGMAFSVALKAGRRYRLKFAGSMKSTVANDRASIIFREGATVLQVGQTPAMPTANSSVEHSVELVLDGVSAGTHAYKVSFQRITGTGNVVVVGTAAPSQFYIEDIGASGI